MQKEPRQKFQLATCLHDVSHDDHENRTEKKQMHRPTMKDQDQETQLSPRGNSKIENIKQKTSNSNCTFMMEQYPTLTSQLLVSLITFSQNAIWLLH